MFTVSSGIIRKLNAKHVETLINSVKMTGVYASEFTILFHFTDNDGVERWVCVEGNHRVAGYQKLKIETIRCLVFDLPAGKFYSIFYDVC